MCFAVSLCMVRYYARALGLNPSDPAFTLPCRKLRLDTCINYLSHSVVTQVNYKDIGCALLMAILIIFLI